MRPMLGWEVVKGKEHFLIFRQAFAGFWEFDLVTGEELIIGRQSGFASRRQVHFMDQLLSWITLQLEIRGWGRFHNRRQVASYTGLCPGIHNSNGRGREGRINRCGNTIVRYTLIEMVWRLIRWQPEYPPIKKLRNALLSKRGKRRLIVAAARRLAIDLWRLATGRATAQELGLQLSQPKPLKATTT